MSDFLAALRDRVLIFDGAFGTWVQAQDLGPDDFGGAALEGCNEHLVLTRPDLIRQMHAEYFEVGVDAVETATFGAFGLVLAEYGIAEETFALNEQAARLAKEVAEEFSTPGKPRFVIGSVGPGTRLPTLGAIGFEALRDDYQVQVEGLLTGGIDVVLVETVYDLLQAKAAIIGARRAMQSVGREVPLMVQVTMETTGRMLVGSEIGAALTSLEAMRPDVIGLNCATGPAEMTEHLRYLAQHARTFLSCLPNAGLPSVVDGHTHYDLTPDALADAHERFVTEFGLNIVGGCCGTTPEHLRAVVERLGTRTPIERTPEFEPSCSSVYSPVTFHQESAYLAVGERTNANGSKKFREAMLEADWDTCVQMAREQVKEGAHVLDVCVDYVGRDGTIDMNEVASRFATQAALPLVFDSTEPKVMEAGLQHSGGKAILNSANLEEGEDSGKRFDRVMSLAREYGAAVICLAIDEEGQARTADWKLNVCRRIYDLAADRYGIEPTDLIFDALTFPLGAGSEDLRRDGIETIEGIRRIKAELPGAHTILGLSNVSFGLKPAARHVLNSVFLHECRDAGLDAAIVHAARIMPMHRIDERAREVTLDLVYDRRRDGYDPLMELMAIFEDVRSSRAREGRPLGLAGRAAPRAPHRRRRPRRHRGRPRRAARQPTRALDHQRRAALGHEDRRRAVRVGRDAAPVRAPERRDHEDRGRVPRAAHGEGRRRRQGHDGDRHRQGRRARHRQEPRRHHPHQQRLRGAQHRHQGPAGRVRGEGHRGERRRHRHERAAREEHDHHAREPRGDEPAGPRRHAGAPRRRRAHAHLRGARPARGVRRTALLRQGRVRGAPHDGAAHGGQAHRRARPRLRARARRA